MVRRKRKPGRRLPEQPCKVCGRLIPKPMVYCSSKCWKKDHKGMRQTDLVKDYNFPGNVPKTLKLGS